MSRASKVEGKDEMLPSYDIRGGVRGKYFERYQQGTNVVLLEDDVATAFPDSASVNRALRMLVDLARQTSSTTKRPASARSAATIKPPTSVAAKVRSRTAARAS